MDFYGLLTFFYSFLDMEVNDGRWLAGFEGWV